MGKASSIGEVPFNGTQHVVAIYSTNGADGKAGLLLYQPGDVKHFMNKYFGNQKNVTVVP